MKAQCPTCRARFNAPDQAVGRKVKCPKCNQPFVICTLAQNSTQETCSSCKTVISQHQQAYVYKSNIVCERCYNNLKVGEQKPPPAPGAEEKPKSKKLSKYLYVYGWASVRFIDGIIYILGFNFAMKNSLDTARAIFIAGNILLICNILIELMLYYKMWAPIQDAIDSISPLKAVLFLFIPLLNIYWALYMPVSFAESYNSFIQQKPVKIKKLPIALYTIYATAFLLSIFVTVPMIFIFARVDLIKRAFITYSLFAHIMFVFVLIIGLFHLIMYIIFAIRTSNALNALYSSGS